MQYSPTIATVTDLRQSFVLRRLDGPLEPALGRREAPIRVQQMTDQAEMRYRRGQSTP